MRVENETCIFYADKGAKCIALNNALPGVACKDKFGKRCSFFKDRADWERDGRGFVWRK